MGHLQLASDAPILLRAAAGAALYAHIGGAVLGLAAGAVALAARKGGPVHRAAGNVFFASMLAMSGVGAVVSPMLADYGSAFGGAITFYLVLTGWLAGRSAQVRGGPLEIAGVAVLGVRHGDDRPARPPGAGEPAARARRGVPGSPTSS